MKTLNYIFLLCLILPGVVACYDDNSKLGGIPLTEVGITTDAADTINIYFNDTLRIHAEVECAIGDLDYQWGIGTFNKEQTVFKKVSEEKDLEYIARTLGHFYLRQLVTTPEGSSIRYYHVFVNSQFEEGYTILGRRPDGKGSIAFMKTLTDEEAKQGMKPSFRQNVFAFANPGKELYDDPVDIDKVGSNLYILHGNSQKLVQIDAKTFEQVFEYDFKFYETDFIPAKIMSYDGKYCREFYVPSRNGGVAMVQTVEQFIFPYTELPKDIVFTDGDDRPSYFSSCNKVYISKDRDAVCWNGCNADREFAMRDCFGYFKNRKVVKVFQNEKVDGNDVYVVNWDGGTLKITGVESGMFNFSKGDGLWVLFERELSPTNLIDENTPMLMNDYYTCVFFAHENKVYKWSYTQNNLPVQPFITLAEGEEVRVLNHFVKSRNDDNYQDYSVQKRIYIATYNPNRKGLPGSLYIYDSDTGQKLAGYTGISDEPVDMFYKIRD